MNIILNNSNDKIGGIEVLLIEIAQYLSKEGHKVYFIISYKNDIYKRYLEGSENIFFIKKYITKDIEFFSNSEIERERKHILSQLDAEQTYYVVSPYFNGIQYAMGVFGDNKRFILSHLWSHPQDWVKRILLIRKGFIKKQYKTPKYYYQRKLIQYLNRKHADFYAARVVKVFNEWYYNIKINLNNRIDAYPISNIDIVPKIYLKEKDKKIFNVVWCGRFEYFKNEAIIQIHKTLESLSKGYPELRIQYDIIGSGTKEMTKDLNQNIIPKNVKVNYCGIIEPNRLAETFKKYDIGIGMGLTVKKMGQVGLPAIIIDSVERGDLHKNNANWLFESEEEGDAGDGYYYRLAGKNIASRKNVYDILREAIENNNLLEEYSKKCIEYVENNYGFNKQIEALLDRAVNSNFAGNNYPIFRRSQMTRIIYGAYKKIRTLIN